MKTNGGPAFPTMDAGELDNTPVLTHPGMSLRDYFAAAALQGLLAGPDFQLFMHDGAEMIADLAARNAYELADAMLAARTK